MHHIINLLFKLFIESGATLHKLVLEFSKSLELKPEIFYILGKNRLFFSQIQHLSLDEISNNNIENAIALLRALAKSTKKISTIEFNFFDSYYEPQIFHAFIYIIKSQEQLRLFSIAVDYSTEFYGIISALERQKNSLQEVILNSCDFSAEFEVLNKCKNLETFCIRHCTTKLQKLLDYKVSTLEVVDCQIDMQAMILIFKKTGILLQRLNLNQKMKNFRIKSFCPNITYLSIQGILFSQQVV
ncbi:hypothetical protein C2G38_2123956, partial [Gigaspora rosea]